MTKSTILLLFLASLILFLTSGCKTTHPYYEVTLTEKANRKTLIIPTNGIIILKLKSNPTTGYNWHINRYNKSFIKFEENTYFSSKTNKQLVGTGGYSFFRFIALAQGESEIKLEYKRAWESDNTPDRVFTIRVQVTGEGKPPKQ